MTEDSFYKKQLEEFGIEQSVLVKRDANKERTEARAEASANVIRLLMDSQQGRQWLHDKLDTFMTAGCPFVLGKPDLTTFFLGVQWAGKTLQDEIMAYAPEKYFTMLAEEQSRKQAMLNQSR